MDKKLMNVLYDISVLGFVHDNSVHKTGIPRVIEELAYELAEIPDCRLKLCSNEYLPGSLKYAGNNARLKEVPFPHHKFGARMQQMVIDTQYSVESTSSTSHIKARAKRKLLHNLTRLAKSSSETLQKDSLQDADIYHSTYLALPKQAKIRNRPQLFLTIYDLIPALKPEFCDAGTNQRFDEIIASITPETWLLSISDFTKVDICDYLKVDPSRVFVTPLAADPDQFYPNNDPEEQERIRKKYHIPEGHYVLSLCTLEPRKNIDHVIRCFVKLVREQNLTDLSLVLAGRRGWDHAQILREIDGAEAVKDRIVITGFVHDEDLAGLYSGAMVFVYPSLYEGFGLPPLEAMQCGTPAITSDTSSLPEVMGDAGIMLDPYDVDGMCQSLLRLHQEPGLREALSAKSVARAQQFSWKRCAEETVQAYRTSLAG